MKKINQKPSFRCWYSRHIILSMLFMLSCILPTLRAQAQHFNEASAECGTKSPPIEEQRIIEKEFRDKISDMLGTSHTQRAADWDDSVQMIGPDRLEIPVYVHFMDADIQWEYLRDWVRDGINNLNYNYFVNTWFKFLEYDIEFHERGEGGDDPVNPDHWYDDVNALQHAVNPSRILNVYVVWQVEGSTVGAGTFPWKFKDYYSEREHSQYDRRQGLFLERWNGGDVVLKTSTFPHEIGHWLGLYHTFQGGCDEIEGDWVDDTPAEDGEGCSPRDTCPNLTGMDPVENLMTYLGGDDDCRDWWSNGQLQRARNAVLRYRHELLPADLDVSTLPEIANGDYNTTEGIYMSNAIVATRQDIHNSSTAIISQKANVKFQAYNHSNGRIRLSPGFHAQNGSTFKAQIMDTPDPPQCPALLEPCESLSDPNDYICINPERYHCCATETTSRGCRNGTTCCPSLPFGEVIGCCEPGFQCCGDGNCAPICP
ncbi:MAG: M43 family zinc metalloprotease [Myxococcota bacterium]|nr:M43 family zinc metalloprotease [Myxococcota bacterium]